MNAQEILSQVYAEIRLVEEDIIDTKLIKSASGFEEQITVLNMSMMGLHRVPTSVAKIESLHSLFLMGNKLNHLPENLFDLKRLRYLTVFNNEIEYLPENLGNLTKLLHLDLGKNKLSSLPNSIGNLKYLKRLNIENNHITSLPPNFINLSSLRVVCMYGNNFDPMNDRTFEIMDYMKETYGTIFYVDKCKIRGI